MQFQKSCDPRMGQSSATRPDMFVGKKQKVSIAFFRMLIPIGLQKSRELLWRGWAAAAAAGALRPRRGISHGLSQPPHTAPPQFAASPHRAALRYIVH